MQKKIMNTELTKADRQMKKLREDAAKGCLMADLARLQELQFERKTERMFWKADPSLEQSGELKHMEEIRFLEEKRPLVSIIRLDQNGKWNQDAETTESEYLLFVNKDTEITDGWMDELLIAMREAARPGAIGAKLVYPEIPAGMANEEKSYMLQHTGIGFKDVIREKAHFIQPYNMKNGQPDSDLNMELQERIAVSKNAMLIKKTVFDEIGGFDDRYIGEYADVDLCLRLYPGRI